jgi:hypothetical protein
VSKYFTFKPKYDNKIFFFDLSIEKRYSNLCALCEHPDKCDYPDIYSGYGGSIKCLVENGGDVAFTKVIYIRKFFGVRSCAFH